MTIQEFPLAWRWTDARYAVFPPEELARLRPCSPGEAAGLFVRAEASAAPDEQTADRISAEGPQDQVVTWLTARQAHRSDGVFVCWSDEMAVKMPWSLFVKRWDDFCYPSSDDVTVLPQSGSWMLLYHHWHEFEFRPGRSANKRMQRTRR
jgi:hypothetical protein